MATDIDVAGFGSVLALGTVLGYLYGRQSDEVEVGTSTTLGFGVALAIALYAEYDLRKYAN